MPLKSIQYAMWKVYIILLLILSLNKVLITAIVNILHWLTKRCGLTNIIKDKIVSIKEDFLTIKNINYIIY